MIKQSRRSHIPSFLALEGLRKAKVLEAAGADIMHLEIGQPSSPAPKLVTQALIQALSHSDSHGYSVAMGLPELREAIAGQYQRAYDYRVSADKIAVTVGSSTAFALAFLTAFDEGDKVALPTPGYPAYRNLMMAMGIEPVALPARAAQGWLPALEEMERWDSLPDGLIIASPHNPTGVVLSDSELRVICQWCDKHGVRLISDEIYHGLSYGKPTTTAAHHSKNAIIISGFSKYYSMTGWRLGWMLLPDDLVEATQKLIESLFISAPTPNQIGAIAAFDASEELDENLRRYEVNRSLLMKGLRPEFLGNYAPCDGAFYLYADVSAITDDSRRLADDLLHKAGVAVTPGIDFDPQEGHKHIRLSFAGATKDMTEAVQRINHYLETELLAKSIA
ncbi:MAG: pyridoxal phosphate-dependent aminotransferase [Candidatus Puniceispirillaceae bacterium]